MTVGSRASGTDGGPHLGPELQVTVLGADPAGFAAADALLERGASVTLVDDLDENAPRRRRDRHRILETLGARLVSAAAFSTEAAASAPVLIVLPRAARTATPLGPAVGTAQRLSAGQDSTLWDETELAWRLRPPAAAPWLLVAGTGSARVSRLVAAVLEAGGLRPAVAGAAEDPLIEAVLHPDPPDVVVGDLGLDGPGATWTAAPLASLLLASGEPTLDRLPGRVAAVYANTGRACVYDAAEPVTERAVQEADVQEGCRAVGVTTGVPAPSFLGLVDDVLCDRAFVPNRSTSAAELCTLEDLAAGLGAPPAPADVRVVLAAAALARAAGVAPGAVRHAVRSLPAHRD